MRIEIKCRCNQVLTEFPDIYGLQQATVLECPVCGTRGTVARQMLIDIFNQSAEETMVSQFIPNRRWLPGFDQDGRELLHTFRVEFYLKA